MVLKWTWHLFQTDRVLFVQCYVLVLQIFKYQLRLGVDNWYIHVYHNKKALWWLHNHVQQAFLLFFTGYQGCYDIARDGVAAFNSSSMDLVACIQFCRGNNASYAALSVTECLCHVTIAVPHAAGKKCNVTCPSSSYQKCGGNQAMSVFKTGKRYAVLLQTILMTWLSNALLLDGKLCSFQLRNIASVHFCSFKALVTTMCALVSHNNLGIGYKYKDGFSYLLICFTNLYFHKRIFMSE